MAAAETSLWLAHCTAPSPSLQLLLCLCSLKPLFSVKNCFAECSLLESRKGVPLLVPWCWPIPVRRLAAPEVGTGYATSLFPKAHIDTWGLTPLGV